MSNTTTILDAYKNACEEILERLEYTNLHKINVDEITYSIQIQGSTYDGYSYYLRRKYSSSNSCWSRNNGALVQCIKTFFTSVIEDENGLIDFIKNTNPKIEITFTKNDDMTVYNGFPYNIEVFVSE